MSDVTATPEGAAPDQAQPQVTAQTEGTQPPVQAAPQPPPQTSGGMFDKVLGALSGNPKTYSIDQSGKETATPVTDRGTLAKHIVAAALVGLLKGAGARGPNSMGQAAAAGGAAGFGLAQQEDQNARQAAQSDFQRQQDVATQKANALEKNLRLRSLAQTLSTEEKATHDQIVANSADTLQRVKAESPDLVLGEGVPEGEAKDPTKYSLTAQRIPDGVVPRLGADGQQEKDADGVPQWEQTYTILDSKAKTAINGAPWVQQAIDWGIPGAKNLANLGPNDQISAVAQNHYIYQLGQLQAMQSELNGFAKKLGIDPLDLKAKVSADPSLIEAVNQFQRTSGASTQPDAQVDAMRSDPKAAPYVSKVIGMFGADNLEQFKENRVNKMAADKAAAEAAAKTAAENSPQAIRGAAAKAGAEANARVSAENSPQAIAGAAAKAKAVDEAKGSNENVYANTPEGQTVLMSKGQAEANNLPYSKVGTPQIAKDRQLNNRLADVNQKLARYELTLQEPLKTTWNPLKDNDATAIAHILQDDKFKAGLFGLELPVDWLNKISNKEFKGELSPSAQKRLVAYYNAREALVGYQAVLSGSGRSNEKAMQLNLDALPSPIDPDNYAAESLKQFKENVKIAGQGLPVIPGVKTPAEMEREVNPAPDEFGMVPVPVK